MVSIYKRAVVYGLIIMLMLGSALPSFLPERLLEKMPKWYASNQFVQGLDLRGGSHLLMTVDVDELRKSKNKSLANEITKILKDSRVDVAKVHVNAERIVITAKSLKNANQIAYELKPLTQKFSSSTPNYILYKEATRVIFKPLDAYVQSYIDDAVERSVEVLRRRLNETGVVEPSIARHGKNNILIQLPGVSDPQRISELLGTTAQLTLHWVADGATRPDEKMTRFDGVSQAPYILEKRISLKGEHIKDARLGFQEHTQSPVVNFQLDKVGAKKFAGLTQNNIGRPLAIVLDDKVLTAPVIQNAITGGRGEISGNFTVAQARDLALLLRAGSLPAPLSIVEERTIGAELGEDAIKMGISMGGLGAVLVLALMLGIYGRWGGIACLGLVVNVGMIFGALSALGATLTIPGIAGIILSIGMAVDAMILINERIKEELHKGKSSRVAFENGFRRALATILDSNITTLIAISLLFMFGEGPVRGFAVTMAIGLCTSMFTVLSLIRLLMAWRVQTMKQKILSLSKPGLIQACIKYIAERGTLVMHGNDCVASTKVNEHAKVTCYDFMRWRKQGLITMSLLFLLSMILLVEPGLRFGIDFVGGGLLDLQTPDASIDTLRSLLNTDSLKGTTIQEFGGDSRFLLRIPFQSELGIEYNHTLYQLKEKILQILPETLFHRIEMVGPKVSGGFIETSILAIFIASLGMLAYIWARFETHFALAAITTVILDLSLTLGFFSVSGIEFNLTAIAALLALIGYSINDKVVVFDRIRESLRELPQEEGNNRSLDFSVTLNQSIFATLSRTILTSMTTVAAILPMVVAGGDAVESFATPMLFGVIIGTLSSIFVACSMLYYLGKLRAKRGLGQLSSPSLALQELEKSP